MYCTAEGHRLHYIASHQADIRADCYKGVQDAVRLSDVSRDPLTGRDVGIPVVLPSSFTGGPRDRGQRHQDALAIVRHGKKPDVFITMTCNSEVSTIMFVAIVLCHAYWHHVTWAQHTIFGRHSQKSFDALKPCCLNVVCNSVVPCMLSPCGVSTATEPHEHKRVHALCTHRPTTQPQFAHLLSRGLLTDAGGL